MDSITFEVGGVTIQLVGDTMYVWNGCADHEADITIPIARLQDVLSAARMLRKTSNGEECV